MGTTAGIVIGFVAPLRELVQFAGERLELSCKTKPVDGEGQERTTLLFERRMDSNGFDTGSNITLST